jgi:hypothetical protein
LGRGGGTERKLNKGIALPLPFISGGGAGKLGGARPGLTAAPLQTVPPPRPLPLSGGDALSCCDLKRDIYTYLII